MDQGEILVESGRSCGTLEPLTRVSLLLPVPDGTARQA